MPRNGVPILIFKGLQFDIDCGDLTFVVAMDVDVNNANHILPPINIDIILL